MAKIHFLNIDEGDCTIIQHDNGKVTMIDICCGNIETKETNAFFSVSEAEGGIKGNYHQKDIPNNPISYLKKRGIVSLLMNRVAMLTSESIHVNIFMFEPLVDTSSLHLKQMYSDVCEQLNQIIIE